MGSIPTLFKGAALQRWWQSKLFMILHSCDYYRSYTDWMINDLVFWDMNIRSQPAERLWISIVCWAIAFRLFGIPNFQILSNAQIFFVSLFLYTWNEMKSLLSLEGLRPPISSDRSTYTHAMSYFAWLFNRCLCMTLLTDSLLVLVAHQSLPGGTDGFSSWCCWCRHSLRFPAILVQWQGLKNRKIKYETI